MADRSLESNDFLKIFARQNPCVRLEESKIHIGSANARLEALKLAKHSIIVFTDDDCSVASDWIVRMEERVSTFGVVTGNLAANNQENRCSQVDAYIDQMRMKSVNELGEVKYISFPNFAIWRHLLPEIPFSADERNMAEDIDLGCRLRLAGIKIYFDESIIVYTQYPTSFLSLLRRKIKHAKGIAFLRANLGRENCIHLGLSESPGEMFFRWSNLALQASLTPLQKVYWLMANIAYCLALVHYDKKFLNQGL